MLSCRDLAQLHASDYLDRQLPTGARLGVSVHLLLCRHCRRFVKQLMLVRKVLQRLPLPELEDTRIQSLAAKLQQEQAGQKIISPPL